jgi:hypothetical protein
MAQWALVSVTDAVANPARADVFRLRGLLAA